ncbi:AzlC family ABC transporter permease, partial [Oscillospiraceae bacterium OttesenSCG-928-G22]|nr:AzlC family ABC transporter permease [Oscillospiraceae bacterium OttesenSCG-928-G22]
LSMFDLFAETGRLRPYMIFSLTDETYSLHCGVKPPEGISRKWFHFFIASLNHVYWVAGCTAGALLGNVFPFSTKGIDFAMTALFVVVFTDQIRYGDRKTRIAGGIGVGIALLCLFGFGGQVFLIPAMAVIVVILSALRQTAWKEASV